MTRSLRIAPMLMLALAASACTSPSGPDGALYGVWGGEGAKLLAGPEGVRVSVGCTGYEAKQPLVPDADGRFLIPNVETIGFREIGGEAILRGTVSGPEIAFDIVTLVNSTTYVTSYTVRKGREADLGAFCLLTARLAPQL